MTNEEKLTNNLIQVFNKHIDTLFDKNTIESIVNDLIEINVFALPCKIDDIIYFIHKKTILSGIAREYNNGYYTTVWNDEYKVNFAIPNIDFGTSAFLSLKEAEEALKKY